MTDEQLREIEKRAEAATPGPWCYELVGVKHSDWVVGIAINDDGKPLAGELIDEGEFVVENVCWRFGLAETEDGNNAAFIAHAREDIPALIAEVRRLRKWIESGRLS